MLLDHSFGVLSPNSITSLWGFPLLKRHYINLWLRLQRPLNMLLSCPCIAFNNYHCYPLTDRLLIKYSQKDRSPENSLYFQKHRKKLTKKLVAMLFGSQLKGCLVTQTTLSWCKFLQWNEINFILVLTVPYQNSYCNEVSALHDTLSHTTQNLLRLIYTLYTIHKHAYGYCSDSTCTDCSFL